MWTTKLDDVKGGKVLYANGCSFTIGDELGNPRNEASENDLEVHNDKFLSLGLNPTTLDSGLMMEVNDIAKKYSQRCDMSKIICTSTWDKNKEVDFEGKDLPQ